MSAIYTISLCNNSHKFQSFFFFQKPATYSNGPLVYSNSLYQYRLEAGATLTFLFQHQPLIGVQARVSPPTVGYTSGYTVACQPVELRGTVQTAALNTVQMTLEPSLALSPATHMPLAEGCCRIRTPIFDSQKQQFNAGVAIRNLITGQSVLSSFVNIQPEQDIECQPMPVFYVQNGEHSSGSVINFATSFLGAAMCDGSAGHTTFHVTFQADGSWTVNAISNFPGLSQLMRRAHLDTPSLNERIQQPLANSAFWPGDIQRASGAGI